jgi:ribosomal protein L4
LAAKRNGECPNGVKTLAALALKEKADGQGIALVESFPETEGKTSALGKMIGKAAPSGRVLVVVDKKSDLLMRAVKNLNRVSIVDVRELSPWALMHAQMILVTQTALKELESRFPQG